MVFRAESGGGGGWGPPAEREPARVLADLRNELIGEDEARSIYKVAVRRDAAGWILDEAATARLRAA